MKISADQKPTFLFLHGAFGSGSQFEPWARKLRERGYEVFHPNFRGHGPGGDPSWVSVLDLVTDTAELIKSLPSPVCLVGQSLGGLVAQLTIALPEVAGRIHSCILLSSTPDERPAFVWRSLKPRYLWAMLSGGAFHFAPQDARYFLGAEFGRSVLYPESGRIIREELFGRCRVKRLTLPMLVFAATQDRFFSLAVQRRIADKHDARLIEVDCGHMIHLSDESDYVLRQLVNWVERLDR